MKKSAKIITTGILMVLAMFAGCGTAQEASEKSDGQPTATVTVALQEANEQVAEPTTEPVAEPTEIPTNTPEPTEAPAPTATPEPTEALAPTNTPEPTEALAPTNTPEPTEAPAPTNTPLPTATTAPTNTPEPTAIPAPTNTPTPVPIVKVEGTVDAATVQKVEKAFKDVVVKMRADALINATDVCIEMNATEIRADITLNNAKKDLVLTKDADTGIYTLKLDCDFIWLEGLGATIHGVDPAAYNKELLVAMLSVVSEEPLALFETIDLTYFSSYVLGDRQWTPVGDCYMMDGASEMGEFWAYDITKEPPVKEYTRDASYTMSYTKPDGTVVEAVIEYDSSVVTFEDRVSYITGETETCFDAVAMEVVEAYGYPKLLSGCSSYEEYQQKLVSELINQGATAISYYELGDYETNGCRYYFFETFYNVVEDPDVVYVQLPGDVYIEIYNVWFTCTLEDFANQVLYVKEVTVK